MSKERPTFEDLVRRVGPLPVAGLASAESPPVDAEAVADVDAEAAWAVELEARAKRALMNPEGGTDWDVVRAEIEGKLRQR
jgi:hypothetical protein